MSDYHDERRIEALQEEIGEWQASDDGSHIYSDRFETDAMLVLSGGFGSVAKRKRYADQIARDLSEIAALRVALDRERADTAKLRAFAHMAAKIAVEMEDDDFGLSMELERAGLIDEELNPTALLSGREESDTDG